MFCAQSDCSTGDLLEYKHFYFRSQKKQTIDQTVSLFQNRRFSFLPAASNMDGGYRMKAVRRTLLKLMVTVTGDGATSDKGGNCYGIIFRKEN